MAAINKIALNSPSRQSPSELETAIAGALFDLESNTQDLKASLRPLQFVSAREVRIAIASHTGIPGLESQKFCVCDGAIGCKIEELWALWHLGQFHDTSSLEYTNGASTL
jgi:hypothetical protein